MSEISFSADECKQLEADGWDAEAAKEAELNYVGCRGSDYWGGHHLPTFNIPVFKGITLKDVKDSLNSDLQQGALNSGRLGWEETEKESWFIVVKKAIAAIEMTEEAAATLKEGQSSDEFIFDTSDIEFSEDEDGPDVYYYFVLIGAEELVKVE